MTVTGGPERSDADLLTDMTLAYCRQQDEVAALEAQVERYRNIIATLEAELAEATRWRDADVEPQPRPAVEKDCWPSVLVSDGRRVDRWECCQWGDDRIHQTEVTHWMPLPGVPDA